MSFVAMFIYLPIFINLLYLDFTGNFTKFSATENVKMGNKRLISVDFEIFGRVQGVFFRKYTQKQAQSLELKGYCMNTSNDTVKGTLQGDATKVEEMKNWLQRTGSPSSRIDRAEFKNESEIQAPTYSSFQIKN